MAQQTSCAVQSIPVLGNGEARRTSGLYSRVASSAEAAEEMPKDLVILAADKNIDYGVQGLLRRPAVLGIRPVEFDTFVHPRHDPGCAREAHAFLRSLTQGYHHALVMFDRTGSGREALPGEALSNEVRGRVADSGWGERAEVIVLDPEIEVWVFAPSPKVEQCLGWPARRKSLRRWLESRGLWEGDHAKPSDPKAALERILGEIKKPRSSAIYKHLGEQVGIRGCTDPAFVRFRNVLAMWFPAGSTK